MSPQRIASIIAGIIFIAIFVMASGMVAKSITLGFVIAAVIWVIKDWKTSVYLSGSDSGGSVHVEKGHGFLDVGSLWAALIIGLCVGGGFLIVFLLSFIPAVKTWIG